MTQAEMKKIADLLKTAIDDENADFCLFIWKDERMYHISTLDPDLIANDFERWFDIWASDGTETIQ